MTLSPRLRGHLHADDDRFLADVEVAEAADQAHAVHLARLLLEAADQQHVPVGREFLLLGEGRHVGCGRGDVAERSAPARVELDGKAMGAPSKR